MLLTYTCRSPGTSKSTSEKNRQKGNDWMSDAFYGHRTELSNRSKSRCCTRYCRWTKELIVQKMLMWCCSTLSQVAQFSILGRVTLTVAHCKEGKLSRFSFHILKPVLIHVYRWRGYSPSVIVTGVHFWTFSRFHVLIKVWFNFWLGKRSSSQKALKYKINIFLRTAP